MLRVCVLLVSVCVLGVWSLSGRGFFCRDPDTGKLHPVNSIWPAFTFCGNYHCKLRRKNITDSEYAPMRKINITNIQLLKEKVTEENVKNRTDNIKKEVVAKTVFNIDEKTNRDTIDTILRLDDIRRKNVKLVDDKKETDRPDRYLSDEEIKTLSEILHSVKKSDLDTILEIYNLAQDIYRDIEKTSTNHVLDPMISNSKPANKKPKSKSEIMQKIRKSGNVSYWYEALSNSNIKPLDLIRADVSKSETIRNDVVPKLNAIPAALKEKKSNVIHLIPKPTTAPVLVPVSVSLLPPPAPNQMRRMSNSYVNGLLSEKDFGKLPYYYSMTDFQRLSSYLHKQKPYKITSTTKPLSITKPAHKSVSYKPQLYTGEKYKKEKKPSVFLPFPFYNIQLYNWSRSPQSNRSEKFDLRNNQNAYQNTMKNNVPKTNAILMNPDLENFQDLEMKPSKTVEKSVVSDVTQKIHQDDGNKRLMPDWQTDSLPQQILEEIRAHIQEKQKLWIHPSFPLRTKVNLERVAKVINIDKIKRNKRFSTQNIADKNKNNCTEHKPLEPELYEVYIDRTTCNSDYSEPGYFQFGNLSKPFPDCCPQRISKR